MSNYLTPLKFSIVTNSFNQARYLRHAIGSVVEQEYPNVEYIVVDPGSTDGSREIIMSYEDRIAKIIFESDNGPSDGLNKGFSHATGDIYGFINADDYFEPGAFSCVGKFFQEWPEIDVVTGAINIINNKGHAKWRKRMSDKFDLKKYVDGRCWFGQQATFFRREAYMKSGGFNVANKTCWDAELMVCMALTGSKFGKIYKVLGNFRLHEHSISGAGTVRDKYIEDLRRIRNITYDVIPPPPFAFLNIYYKILYKLDLRRQLINYLVK